jgi:hypothetical protein
MNRILLSALFLTLAGCAGAGNYPTLNPRPIETKAEGLLAEPATPVAPLAPASQDTQSKIDAALRRAREGVSAFDAALPSTRTTAGAAGASGSESWINAQMAVSALEQHRGPVKSALADLGDLLRKILSGPPSEDLALVQEAIRAVEALDTQQNNAMTGLLRSISR